MGKLAIEEFFEEMLKKEDPFTAIMMKVVLDNMLRLHEEAEEEAKVMSNLSPIEQLIAKEIKWLKNNR